MIGMGNILVMRSEVSVICWMDNSSKELWVAPLLLWLLQLLFLPMVSSKSLPLGCDCIIYFPMQGEVSQFDPTPSTLKHQVSYMGPRAWFLLIEKSWFFLWWVRSVTAQKAPLNIWMHVVSQPMSLGVGGLFCCDIIYFQFSEEFGL